MSITTRFHDQSGRTLTAGMLAILDGRKPEYPSPRAPNALRPSDVLRAATGPKKSTIVDYVPRVEDEPEPESELVPLEELGPRARVRQRIYEMVAQGKTRYEMAEELGKTRKAINQLIRRMGLKVKRGPNKREKVGGDHDEKIREMALAGAAQVEIAEATGLSKCSISPALHRLGIHAEWRAARDSFLGVKRVKRKPVVR